MIDDEQIAALVYNHVVQLTLIDVEPGEAFALAHRVATWAFDPDFTRAGLAKARLTTPGSTKIDATGNDDHEQVSVPKR